MEEIFCQILANENVCIVTADLVAIKYFIKYLGKSVGQQTGELIPTLLQLLENDDSIATEIFKTLNRIIRNYTNTDEIFDSIAEIIVQMLEAGVYNMTAIHSLALLIKNSDQKSAEHLEQLYTKVSKKHDVAEIASVKWHTLCDQTVNELGFVVHFAKRIDEVAKLMLVYRTRPASLFQKRKASPSEVIVQWKEGPSSPNRRRKKSHEALANIPKPEVDHSMSHLIVYDRIAKLRKENEELRARIGESQIDLAYVKSLRDKNYEYTEELAQLQEEYERLQAQAESRGIRLK